VRNQRGQNLCLDKLKLVCLVTSWSLIYIFNMSGHDSGPPLKKLKQSKLSFGELGQKISGNEVSRIYHSYYSY